MELSESVRALLSQFRETFGDVVITSPDAMRLYSGRSGGKVSHLADDEILQLAFCQAHDAINELSHELKGANLLIETLEKRLAKQPNRAKRRHP
jgi:hypothetical protein